MVFNTIFAFKVMFPLETQRRSSVNMGSISSVVYRLVVDYFEREPDEGSFFSEISIRKPLPNEFEDAIQVEEFHYFYKSLIVNPEMDFSGFEESARKSIASIEDLFKNKDAYTQDILVKVIRRPEPRDEILTKEYLDKVEKMRPTFNNFELLREPLDFYLAFFEPVDFDKYLECIASAYIHRYELEKDGKNRPTIGGWRKLVHEKVGKETISDAKIRTAFSRADNLAYTIITLHKLVEGMGRSKKIAVGSYLKNLIAYEMRKAFNGEKEAMARAFSLYIRDEVFFMDGDIWRFYGNHCEIIDAMELTQRVQSFKQIVESNFRDFTRQKETSDDTLNEPKWEKNKLDCLKQFEISPRGVYIKNIARGYLVAKRKTGVDLYGTAFKDGLVFIQEDGDKKKLVIREMLMEDQIFGCGNAYIFPEEKYSDDHWLVKEILDCFEHIFQQRALVTWFLIWMASTLAKQPERILLILFGKSAGNAKTTLMHGLYRVYGDYYAGPAANGLLHIDPTSGHQSALAELEHKNLVFLDEPTTKTATPVEMAKTITGAKTISASKKCKDGKTFYLTFKFVFMVNQIPKFTEVDFGLIERLRIIECIGCYRDKSLCNPGNSLVREKVVNFWDRDGIPDALLYLMLSRWNEYQEKGLGPTEGQLLALDRWKDGVCTVKRFLLENCKKDPQNATISPYDVDQVWETYESWHRQKANDEKKEAYPEFMSKLREQCKIEERQVVYKDSKDPGSRAKELTKSVVFLWMKNPVLNEMVVSRCALIDVKQTTNDRQVARNRPEDEAQD